MDTNLRPGCQLVIARLFCGRIEAGCFCRYRRRLSFVELGRHLDKCFAAGFDVALGRVFNQWKPARRSSGRRDDLNFDKFRSELDGIERTEQSLELCGDVGRRQRDASGCGWRTGL